MIWQNKKRAAADVFYSFQPSPQQHIDWQRRRSLTETISVSFNQNNDSCKRKNKRLKAKDRMSWYLVALYLKDICSHGSKSSFVSFCVFAPPPLLSLYVSPCLLIRTLTYTQVHTPKPQCTLFAGNLMVSWTSARVMLGSQPIYLSKPQWGGCVWKASLH